MSKDDYTPNTAIEIYKDNGLNLEIVVDRDARDVWLTRRQVAQLLDLTARQVENHIKQYREKVSATKGMKKVSTPTSGGNQMVEHYAIDVLLYVAYRAQSTKRVLAFREWVAGIVERHVAGKKRDTEIRTYEGVRNLITQASDYDPSSDICRQHFAMVQNKLLYAVSGFTAAGLIVTRADHLKQNMGLNSWSGHKILLNDATVGKNYLTNGELDDLQKLAELIYALMNVFQRGGITMADWIKSLDQQIVVARRGLLEKYVGYSRVEAEEVARREYAAYTKQLKSEYQQLQLL